MDNKFNERGWISTINTVRHSPKIHGWGHVTIITGGTFGNGSINIRYLIPGKIDGSQIMDSDTYILKLNKVKSYETIN